MRWVYRCGSWWLIARGKRPHRVACVGRDRHGWMVVLRHGECAGPYDLEVARQSAEKRAVKWAVLTLKAGESGTGGRPSSAEKRTISA